MFRRFTRFSAHKYLMPSFQFRIFLLLEVIAVLASIRAANVPLLHLGSGIQGNTIGADHLVKVDMYSNGQALLEVPISEEMFARAKRRKTAISVTTCSNVTSFDTVLYLFASNPLGNKTSTPKWVSRNDNDCGLQSTIQVRIEAKASLFFLLSGYRGSEGRYEVQVQENVDGEFLLPWGLDRIDQRRLPLNGQFSIKEAGRGVFIYVLDSGVLSSHEEFLGEDGTSRVIFGNDFVGRMDVALDDTGHGTHVAAVAAGKNFGVAKLANIVSVRVLDRTNSGLVSQVVEALVWTTEEIFRRNHIPAVITMSLSTSKSEILNKAIAKVTSAGIAVIAAAGNNGQDSCLYSPATEKSVLTAGATNSEDRIAKVSNWGKCVNIYAPGEDILSAWHTGNSATKLLSGTSAACPLVAGATAVLLEQNPSLKADDIRDLLLATATATVKKNGQQLEESAKRVKGGTSEHLERMLYVRSIPVILRDGRPSDGKMFLYVIFGLHSEKQDQNQCELHEDLASSVRGMLGSIFAAKTKASTALKLCCQGSRESNCDDGSLFTGKRLLVRVTTSNSHAYASFESLAKFCREKDTANPRLKNVFGMNVSVVAEPWVIDSRGYKYWAAPAFRNAKNRGLSTTQVVGLSFLVILLVLCFLALIVCLIQRFRKKQMAKHKKYLEEKVLEYEIEKRRHADLEGHEDLQSALSLPHGIRRTNSELQEDTLRCLSPSGIVPTPTANLRGAVRPQETKSHANLGIFAESLRALEDQSREDGEENKKKLPEALQTVTSFFSRVWTPRAGRRTTFTSSSRGRIQIGRLPKILSFGPGRGATVQSVLPSPAEHGSSSWTAPGAAEKDGTVRADMPTPSPSSTKPPES